MAGRVELSVVAKNQASKVLKQVGGDIRGLSKEAGNAKSSFNEMFSVAGGNLLARGIQGATSAVLGLGKAFVGLGVDAVQSGAEVNAQISGITAVLGLAGEDVEKVSDLISDLAMNPKLKVDLQGAAGAIDVLARNGLKLDQIMGGAAESSILLANATGGGFESAASVMTDVVQQWRGAAGSFEDITNGVVSTTDASKLSLEDYALGIAAAGGVMAAYGVEFKDFNAALALTVPLSSGGSDAGTSLKSFVMQLVPTTAPAMEAMAELGLYTFNVEKAMQTLGSLGIKPLSNDMNGLIGQLMKGYAATHKVNLGTEEGLQAFNAWAKEAGFVQNAFYDANGQMKDMADISQILGNATAGLSEADLSEYLKPIFGTDGIRAAIALAHGGEVAYTDLKKASQELGVSQESLADAMKDGVITQFEAMLATMGKADAMKAAAIRNDNLAGDMDILSGTIESVKKQLSDNLDPALRTVAQAMNQWLTSVTPQLLAFGNVIGTKVTSAVTRLTNAFGVFKSGGSVADIGKALGISPKIIGAITWVIKNINLLKGAIKGIAVAIAAGGAFAALGTALAALTSPFGLLIGSAAALSAAWETNFGGIREKTQFAQDAINDFLAAVQNAQSMASLTFSVTGEVSSSLMAGLAELTGGKTTIDTEAKVVSIDWGDTSYTYDADSQVTSIDWVGGLVGGIGDFTYDAKSKVLDVDWASSLGDGGMGFTYDADAGITAIDWNAEGLTYTYDAAAKVTSVNFAEGLYAGKYTAVASISSVLWGIYYGHYEADAGVTDVVWGLYTHTYQPDAEVTKVLWGLYRTTYEADAKISTVSWLGGAFTHTYDALAKIGSVDWLGGAYTHTYDARAQVGEKGVLWGLWTWQYSASAGVTEVTFAGGVLEKAGAALSELSVTLGSSLETAASSIGTSLGAPAWVQNLIDWKPSDTGPSWLTTLTDASKDLVVSAAPGLLTTLSSMVIKPPTATDMGPLLTMTIPTLPVDFWPTLPTWTWPDYTAWAWPTLPIFSWPTLPVIKWPSLPSWVWTALPTFAWPSLPTFIWPSLPAWSWPAMPSLPTFTWPTLPAFTWPDYSAWSWPALPAWSWPELPALALAKLPTWSWPSLPAFSWPSLPEWSWPDLPGWEWPSFPSFSWPDFPTFTWPSIPTPTWLADLRNWRPSLPSFFGGSDTPGQNASGTDNWRGGWTWVGERGPELLNLPKGSQVLSNTESKKMIGQLADGTTTAAAATPKGGGNVFAAISSAAANMAQAGNKMSKAGQIISDSMKDLEANLRKVPGLFGSSQVTEQQMKMGALGIPQNFADDWLRRLTDEVVNGVNWEGVDIKDAALRAGLDPALPAEAILELVTQKWNDKSLFANPANLDLINQDAVKAALEAQAQQAAGEQNLLGLFGVTPEQARTAGTATGTAAGGGVLTGITQSLTTGNAGQQVAGSIATGVTPESMAPVGGSVVAALTTELGKEEYGDQVGAALAGLFTGYLEKADAFVDVAQRIMAKIAAQFSNVGALDMIARFVESFRAQLGSEEAIASLTTVGEKILELVFRGYLDEALRRNWAEGVNAKGDTSNKTTTSARNAIGTSSWRGGMTWVGETGPELVSLPPRTRIFNPDESMALAGAGGGDVYVTINATVADSIDVQQMAYRVADILRRRR